MEKNNELVKINDLSSGNWQSSFEEECWVAPSVDISESEDNFEMLVNMPGVEKDNLKIRMEERDLIIMGKANPDTGKIKRYILRENGINNYYRKFRLSTSIDETKIEADYHNGQLKIVLPKHEKAKPRSIEVK